MSGKPQKTSTGTEPKMGRVITDRVFALAARLEAATKENATLREAFANEQEARLIVEAKLTQANEMGAIAAKMANTDPLTRLANRRAYDAALRHMTEDATRTPDLESNLVVMLMDLDHFKDINDKLGGHTEGDKALQDLAAQARRILHPRDNDILARIGGDEFAMLAKGNPTVLRAHLEALQTHLYERQTLPIDPQTGRILQNHQRFTISCGVACLDTDFILRHYGAKNFSDLDTMIKNHAIVGDHPITRDRIHDDLVAEADAKMYENKKRPERRSAVTALEMVRAMQADALAKTQHLQP